MSDARSAQPSKSTGGSWQTFPQYRAGERLDWTGFGGGDAGGCDLTGGHTCKGPATWRDGPTAPSCREGNPGGAQGREEAAQSGYIFKKSSEIKLPNLAKMQFLVLKLW